MAKILELTTFSDERGKLTVIDRILPFEVKRVFYIYEVVKQRGGHRHKKTKQALICLKGSCGIYVNNGIEEKTIILDNPSKCLLLEPEDWHIMYNFSQDAVLLVLASEHYDKDDYIFESY